MLLFLTACGGSALFGKDAEGGVAAGGELGCNLTVAVDAVTTTWQYDADDRLLSSHRSDGTEDVAITYSDDRVASITRTTPTDTVIRSFAWEEGRLVGVEDSTGYHLELLWKDGALVAYVGGNDGGASAMEGELTWDGGRPVVHTRRTESGTIGGYYTWARESVVATEFGGVARSYGYDGEGVTLLDEVWYGGDKTWAFAREDGRLATFSVLNNVDQSYAEGIVYYDDDGEVSGYYFEQDVVVGGTCPRSFEAYAPGHRLEDPARALWGADDPRISGGVLCLWCGDAVL